MKKTKATLSGGFHNAGKMNVFINIPESVIDRIENSYDIDEYISDCQRNRLNKHFCGIASCSCGGYLRADIMNVEKPKNNK